MVRVGSFLNKMELDVKGKQDAISCLNVLISAGFHEIISSFMSLDLSWSSY